MEEQTKIEELTDKLKSYLDTRYELVVLNTSDKVSTIGSQLIAYLIIGVLSVLFVILLSIALSLYISEICGNTFSGFFIVAGVYFISAVLFLIFKKQISTPFRNKIIKEVLSETR